MAIINSRPSKLVDFKIKPHCGEQAIKDGRLYGDKRCMICGDWYTWVDIEPEYCFEPSVIRKLREAVGGNAKTGIIADRCS